MLKKADEKLLGELAKLYKEEMKKTRRAICEEAKVYRAKERSEKAASRAQQKENLGAVKTTDSQLNGKR